MLVFPMEFQYFLFISGQGSSAVKARQRSGLVSCQGSAATTTFHLGGLPRREPQAVGMAVLADYVVDDAGVEADEDEDDGFEIPPSASGCDCRVVPRYTCGFDEVPVPCCAVRH